MVQPKLNFGVDLVTFHHPKFWGVEDYEGITQKAEATPGLFWDTILDAVAEAGIKGIELTFAPFDWEGAVNAYGTAEAFSEAMTSRDLTLCSGFFVDLANFAPGDDETGLTDRAVSYAKFLRAGGADIMVTGLPMRQTPALSATQPYDLEAAQALAGLVHRIAKAVAECGVRLALHTEAHSVFAAARDVDLMMLLTDPADVHMCPDTAHLILMGGDPIQIVDRHHERMIIAHWKDAIGPMPADTPIDADIHDRHRPYFCGFGLGRVDWPAWMRLLNTRGYQGWAILELDAAPDPVGDLKRGLTFVRQALLPITS
ncbi:sugar phosphate isomerase/epimerase family protein [Celeribacter neptunius]|uniref:Sugar phosphate isomerase/epimerase n=1 Tax=Celeribacter neptunius TaxID=588602 RepID=A0A1I3PPQ0_9RHOB|nr:sugar phosphate isomerase/epimerase [Celeribacter neptunius]SFJ23482.1 Sugar phosphate isomerase/epimerase [Celeribacter neptunius]